MHTTGVVMLFVSSQDVHHVSYNLYSPANRKIKLHNSPDQLCGGNVLSLWSFFTDNTLFTFFFCSFSIRKMKRFFIILFIGFLRFTGNHFSFFLMNYILHFFLFLIKLHWAKKVRAGGGPGLRAPPSPWWFFELTLSTRVPLVDRI